MSEEFVGFQTAPKMQIQAAFEEVARRSMHDLSFLASEYAGICL